MVILSRILAALFAGLILFQIYATAMKAPVVYLIWTVILWLPLTLALLGRGGKLIYVVALVSCWLLAGLVVIALPLEIYLDHFTDYAADDPNLISVTDGLLISAIGFVGIAGHYCITRLHPVASRNVLARTLNHLFLDTIRRQAMAFAGNIVLIVMVMEAGWMFREVAIVYLYESILITLFTIWTVKQHTTFERRHACFVNVSDDQAKKNFCAQNLGAYFFFYALYLGVILMVGGLPEKSELGAIAVLAVAWFCVHYIDAKEERRTLRNQALDLVAIESRHTWRILPIHFGCMLGFLAIGNDDPGLALLFIAIKMISEIVQEASGYYQRRKHAIHQRKRRPAPPDLGGIAASVPVPLISLGDNQYLGSE